MNTPRTKITPVVTYGLIALCVLFTLRLYWMLIAAAMEPGKLDVLAFFKASGIGFVPKNALHSPWPWITAIFYHAGPSHLFWNSLSLWMFGRAAERELSRAHYLELFLVSGLLGCAFNFLFFRASETPGMGASGAISGLMVFYFLGSATADGKRIKPRTFGELVRTYWVCALALFIFILPEFILAVLQAKGAAVGKIGYLAHAGGAVGGWFFHQLLRDEAPAPRTAARRPLPAAAPVAGRRREPTFDPRRMPPRATRTAASPAWRGGRL